MTPASPFHLDPARIALRDATPGAISLAALSQAAPEFQDTFAEAGEGLARAFTAAPYLARCAQRRPDALARLLIEGPHAAMAHALKAVRRAGEDERDVAALGRVLRREKTAAHLVIALADLAGVWILDEVTGALSAMAEAGIMAALAGTSRASGAALATEEGWPPGYFILALGKLGGHELNYSSDVDLVVFFDTAKLGEAGTRDPARYAVRLTQDFSRLLSQITAEGYAQRVDLRLRPDPGATAAAVATTTALRYYERLGATWERAAFIKARPVAGDLKAAEAFLSELEPFVWRRSLDFAVIDELHAMKLRMHREDDGAPFAAADVDLKRQRGGIRDIEFFAQVQQLIHGGRDTSLRTPRTVEALARLAASARISQATAASLSADYRRLRDVEHRIQMRQDEQTHTLPERAEARAAVAALCGAPDLATFDAQISTLRARVHGIYARLFAPDAISEPAEPVIGSSHAAQRLEALGFQDVDAAVSLLNAWAAGRVRATRSTRARELLARLAPKLTEACAATGSPDLAFARFTRFFEEQEAGVALLSLFVSQDALLRRVLDIVTLAPHLANSLASHPQTLDLLLDPAFSASPAHWRASQADVLAARLGEAHGFEGALNAARRHAREAFFGLGAQLVSGDVAPLDAGETYADIADVCVRALLPAAVAEVADQAGPLDTAFCVLAMGKHGGRELMAGSDLDLVIIYEPGEAAQSSGPKPLDVDTYARRVTQRLIAALSAPTEEGGLYEVDMQLRPSGGAGPIAVRCAAWERYYARDAWTWEMLALTRARPVAGDQDLCARVAAVRRNALTRVRDVDMVRSDVAAMRTRLAREKPARSRWDVKRAPGGLMDVEFIAQQGQIVTAALHGDVLHQGTCAALEALAAAGALNEADAHGLLEAARLQLGLAQMQRIVEGGDFDPDASAPQVQAFLAESLGFDALSDLRDALFAAQDGANALADQLIGPV